MQAKSTLSRSTCQGPDVEPCYLSLRFSPGCLTAMSVSNLLMVLLYNLKPSFSRGRVEVVKLDRITWLKSILFYPKCSVRFWIGQSDTLVTFGWCLFWIRFWLDFGSILAIFLAVISNSIHPLASIPAFAMPVDQVQSLTFTSGSTIYPSSVMSDFAPQSDTYPAAAISSSTASMLHNLLVDIIRFLLTFRIWPSALLYGLALA